MLLRRYQSGDLAALIALFTDTVKKVNRADYSEEQCAAWTAGIDPAAWNRRYSESFTLVAEEAGKILGFANLLSDGCLDMLYVHAGDQRKGVASALTASLEAEAFGRGMRLLYTYASLTARPFFEKRGYGAVSENTVLRHGVELKNFYMEKILLPQVYCGEGEGKEHV